MMLLVCAATAMATTHTGSLTYVPGPPSDDGVQAFGAPTGNTWSQSNFTIAWTVTNEGTPMLNGYPSWQYSYALTTESTKAFSNVLISVSTGFSLEDFQAVTGGMPGWAPSEHFPKTMPTSPAASQWLKFSKPANFSNDLYTVDISFYSTRVPVWGSFFADDGKTKIDGTNYENFAYNREFCEKFEGVGLAAGTFAGYIIRPDGVSSIPPVPEPLTMVSAFLMIGGLGAYIRRRTGRAVA